MLRRFSIFWFAVLIATILLWWRGEAWVLDGEGQGYRWPDYIHNAWMISLQESRLYDPFRNPLHGFCVATLGTLVGSYINAAILISSLSIWLVMFSCARAVQIWVGDIPGAVVAILISLSLPLADASQWANLYPMLAGGISLCIWSVSMVWVQRKGVVFSGFAGGLAWAIDPRAVPFVLLVCLSVLWNGVRHSQKIAMMVAILFLGIGYSLQAGFGMAENHHLQTQDYVKVQKDVVISRMNSHNNPVLTQKCQNISSDIVFSLELLKTPCGEEMLQENLQVGFPRQLTLPLSFVIAFSAICFAIPTQFWLGRILICGCVLGTAGISFLTMAIEERYMLLNTAPMMAMAICGVFLLLRVIKFPYANTPIAMALIFWGVSLDDTRQELGGRPGTRGNSNNRIWNESARFVARKLPKEALFLDCGAQSVNLSLLPQKTIPDTPPALFKHMMTEGVARYCVQWLSSPPKGDVYFGIGAQHWQDSSGTSAPHYQAVLQELSKRRFWKKVGNTPYYSLYRYTPLLVP